MNRYNRGYPENTGYACHGRCRRDAVPESRPAPETADPCTENGRLALAFSYVPSQPFTDLYEPQEALAHGTLFAALDKPYEGGRRR